MQWPRGKNRDVHWRSKLLQILQEVRANCKTCNQLTVTCGARRGGGGAQQQQAQGGAPEGQGVLAVGLGVDRRIPPPAIHLAPAPEVKDNGCFPGGQRGGEELREKV